MSSYITNRLTIKDKNNKNSYQNNNKIHKNKIDLKQPNIKHYYYYVSLLVIQKKYLINKVMVNKKTKVQF